MTYPMTPRLIVVLLLVSAFALAGTAGAPNPPATGFDAEGSSPRAVEIADEVMEALGGRDRWDATRHIRWRFFGGRLHVWDRHTGDIRVEGVDRETGVPYVVLMNIESKKGRAWRSGSEVTAQEELEELLDHGEAAWINDGYWMFMPYKLKDSGVTLTYVGERALADGRPADMLELTFRDVGRTPENKYHVYVSRDRRLVEQWDFFASAADPEPRFTTPWANWRRYGSILLSDGRGDGRHTDIAVFDTLPASVYGDPAPVDWGTIESR